LSPSRRAARPASATSAPLESAVAQPRAAFGGTDLYPSLAEKGAALCYSLALNHPFVDGNKRAAHAALEAFLILNGRELDASVDDAEHTMLGLAAGGLAREAFVAWVVRHLVPARS
jgi:death-on-curing protein